MRHIQWSLGAIEDIKRQIEFIAEDNPAAAGRVAERLRQSGSKLGAMATGRRGRVAGTFELVVTGLPYILVYTIRTDQHDQEWISILHVIHTSRRWPARS